MIADRASAFKVQSTLQGQDIKMGFDENSLVHIMSILTDLYSDPERAIIREYATNAYDAHVEAGQTRPIEVTTPTSLSPYLRVKDYGVGLSAADIETIYSKYGASTKRDTNDQVGMLGLGCKSALTYSDQFSLIGCKDGERCTVSVSRDAEGAGQMTVVDVSITSDPNGVEVVIPAKRENQLEKKARAFFSYWPEGSVLLNGQAPQRFKGALKLSDALYVLAGDRYDDDHKHYVIMGNVPYPVKNFNVDGLAYNHRVLAFVDIGDVHFTPSREELHYTPTTKATLERVAKDVAAKVQAAAQADINDAPNAWEAVKRLNRWHASYNFSSRNTFTYKGQIVPWTYEHPGMVVSGRASGNLGSHSTTPRLYANSYADTLFVYDYTLNFTANHKRKLRLYCEQNGLDQIKQFAMVKDRPQSAFIDPKLIVKWDEIKAVQLPKAAGGGGYGWASNHIPGSYKAFVNGSYNEMLPCDDIAKVPKQELVYIENGSQWNMSADYATTVLDAQPGNYTLVLVPLNRLSKFKRLFPYATLAAERCKALYKAWEAKLSKQQREAMALHDSNPSLASSLKQIDPAKVDDPDLVSVTTLGRVSIQDLVEQRYAFTRLVPGLKVASGRQFKNPLDKYPLSNVRSYPKESYEYINAVYAARQKGGS